ncbi:MAG: hypothetical protein JNM10_10840 [Planctomycetia bacterium]|nr:hypothetical protein [Planctomycetia bacterium]
MARLTPVLLAAVVAGAAAFPLGCSKPAEVATADPATEAALAELQREVRTLREEREATLRATGVTGSEHRTLVDVVAELRDEVKRLKEVAAAAAAAPPPTAAAGRANGDPGAGAAPVMPTTFLAQGDGTYTPEQLDAFGRIYDEVVRRRDEAQQLDRMRQNLAQAGVTLTPDQEAAMMKLQKQFQEKRQELLAANRGNGRPQSEADQQAMRTKFEELRTAFETDVRAAVPAPDADKVVEAMKRSYPGFFPRGDRQDRMRPGMGG